LTEEGDLDIGWGDWMPLANPKVPEDVSGLPFSFAREFHYSHPRTTMLMFGPKNAPAKQTHYLYLPMKPSASNGDSGSGKEKETAAVTIGKQEVPKGVIMIITQFDGIPMADCFKIVQYFSFDRLEKPGSLSARVGVNVHFVKYTMLKAQVRDGVKEELSVLAQKWCAFANSRVSKVAGTLGFNVESAGHLPSPALVDVSAVADDGLKADTSIERKKSFDETSQQKDKRASRRLPKILFSEEKEKNTPIGVLKSIARAVFGFFEVHLEGRLASVLVACLLVVVAAQWRHNGALSRRVEAFEGTMQRLERSIVNHDDHRQLLNTVDKLSKSHLEMQSDVQHAIDFIKSEQRGRTTGGNMAAPLSDADRHSYSP
jgi:VAD1 Analog of StAR-related lipid transfer domain